MSHGVNVLGCYRSPELLEIERRWVGPVVAVVVLQHGCDAADISERTLQLARVDRVEQRSGRQENTRGSNNQGDAGDKEPLLH